MMAMSNVEQGGRMPPPSAPPGSGRGQAGSGRSAQIPIPPNDPPAPAPPPPSPPPGPDIPGAPVRDPPGPEAPLPDDPQLPPAGDPMPPQPTRMREAGAVAASAAAPSSRPREIGGPSGPEPTRYGDWERKGRVSDF